jgi:hypothetical protein
MSSQFSYELDERQIKILMQSGEVDYTETAWQRFDSNINKEVTTSPISGFSPKINFGISRSIVVPILFVGLIGSLSVLLFSFVDFKKKEEVATEVPLIATPPVIKKTEEKPKQPIVTKTAPVKTVKDSVPVATPTIQTAIKEPVKPVTETNKPEVQSQPVKETVTTAKVATTAKPEVKEPVVPHKKKKRKRMSSEDLPSITTPANLSSGSTEPELELR